MTRASDIPAPAQRWFSWGRLKQMVRKEMKQLVREQPWLESEPIGGIACAPHAAGRPRGSGPG